MKKWIFLPVLMLMFSTTVLNAQNDSSEKKSGFGIAIGGSASTNGLGVNLIAALTPSIAIRAGYGDNMVVNGRGNQEYDLTVGINKEIAGFTLGGGATYYFYPNNNGGPSNDFIEPFVSASRVIGPVTAKGTLNWAPKQAAIGNASNLYGSFELSGQVPSTPVTLNAKLGGNFSKLSFLSYGKRYMDWSIGATVPYKNVTFGVAYVDTNFKNAGAQTFDNNTYAKAGVLGSITASF